MEPKKKNLRRLHIVYNDNKPEEGIFKITALQDPAIEQNVFLFEEQKQFEFAQDKKRGLIMGPIMIPDQRIYRNDPKLGEFTIEASAETIARAAMNFMKNRRTTEINVHQHKSPTHGGLFFYNLFVTDKEMGIHAPDKFKDLAYGTMFGVAKVEDPQVLADIEAGKIKGFSIEAFFGFSEDEPEYSVEFDKQISRILEEN